MTAPYRQFAKCRQCGTRVPLETPFVDWFRNHRDFDSVHSGIVRFDLDLLIHRYHREGDGFGNRQLQYMMFVEVKTHGADLGESQKDSLYALDQILRNRKPNNPKRNGRRVRQEPVKLQAKNHKAVAKILSSKLKRRVGIRLFGGHLLRLSGDRPDADGCQIEWDRKKIDLGTLIGLLRFDLDPDKLRPMDSRRRAGSFRSVFSNWICATCGEDFDLEVIHCPVCHQHYPIDQLHECLD